jgi:hypothetical protein
VVTVRSDDSLCWNNIWEPGYGGDYVGRKVRIVPTDGIMAVEAFAIGGGSRPPVVVAVYAGNRVLVEHLGNPVSVPLTGGTEVIAFVAMVLRFADDAIVHVDDVDGSTMTGRRRVRRIKRIEFPNALPCDTITSSRICWKPPVTMSLCSVLIRPSSVTASRRT